MLITSQHIKLFVCSSSMLIPIRPDVDIKPSMMRRWRGESRVVKLGMVIENGKLIRLKTEAKNPAEASATMLGKCKRVVTASRQK